MAFASAVGSPSECGEQSTDLLPKGFVTQRMAHGAVAKSNQWVSCPEVSPARRMRVLAQGWVRKAVIAHRTPKANASAFARNRWRHGPAGFQYERPTRECTYTFAARHTHTRRMKLRHLLGLIAILIATL